MRRLPRGNGDDQGRTRSRQRGALPLCDSVWRLALERMWGMKTNLRWALLGMTLALAFFWGMIELLKLGLKI